MTRRFGLISVIAGGLLLVTSASAAVAPLAGPFLTSVPSASPVSIHWTPAAAGGNNGNNGEGRGNGHGHGHGHGDRDGGHDGDGAAGSVQAVLRADGPCASPSSPARVVAIFADSTTSDFSDPVPSGTYCYSIAVSDAASTAYSPGLTVVVGALAAIAPGPSAGPIGSAGVATASVAATADLRGPVAARQMTIGRPRVRVGASGVHVMVRWTDPIASGLERVDVVMNSRRPPRDATDGTVVYRGRGTSIVVQMRAGQTRYLALFASDAGGNVSAVARRVVSLASLVPLRPISGSSVSEAPLLTWKPTKGASYYNLQLFRNGRRVLIAWPSRPSFRVPAPVLSPGTYVWFVWPALEARHATPRFADLIGRATFNYFASGTAPSR